MKRLLVIIGILFLCLTAMQAQNPGDKATTGYSYNRANLNPDTGNFKPPFKLEATLALPVIQDAQTLNLFDNYLLVGEDGGPGNYTLINDSQFTEEWTRTAPAQPSGKVFEPAYANGIVLMTGSKLIGGGSGTTSQAVLRAVDAATNVQLWEDSVSTVWDGRTPVIMNEMAFYHSRSRVKAVKATTGVTVWSREVSTAATPLSVFGDQVYISRTSSIAALDIATEDILWETSGVGGDGCKIIPTQRNVFVANPATGSVVALDSYSGIQAWSVNYPKLGSNPIAAAYGYLYVFYSNTTLPSVAALNQLDGTIAWVSNHDLGAGGFPTPDYGQVSNNHVYFYNTGSERIRILDAFNGNTVWSIHSPGVRDLAINGEYLFGLRAAELDVYKPVNLIYLSHVVEGTDPINPNIAISTMFVINNGEHQFQPSATGTFRLFKSNGTAMEVRLTDLEGNAACPTCDPLVPVSEIPIEIDGEASIAFATTGDSSGLVVGFAEVETDIPVSATSIFRTTDNGAILFEAGVGSTEVTSKAVIFVTSNNYESVGGIYNSGIIMANPMDEDTDIEVTFKSEDGSTTLNTTITLPAGTHTARFVSTSDGLFPALEGINITGSLVMKSNIPFAAAALRTQNGFQMSSYPMATPQQ